MNNLLPNTGEYRLLRRRQTTQEPTTDIFTDETLKKFDVVLHAGVATAKSIGCLRPSRVRPTVADPRNCRERLSSDPIFPPVRGYKGGAARRRSRDEDGDFPSRVALLDIADGA